MTHFAMRRLALSLLPLAWSAFACDRTPEPKSDAFKPTAAAPTPQANAPVSAAPAASSKGEENFRLASHPRVVAIGDVHGDLGALREALRLAGAIDSDDRWVGKDLAVVQTGDQVDRGDQDREVLDVLEKLEGEAEAAGGALHVLNGNHELMNAMLDFRYVTAKSFVTFDDMKRRAPAGAQRLPEAEHGRAAAFAPGGPYARKLAKHLTIAQVGDSLFAHAGVLPAHVDYGLSRINREASTFLAGKLREPPRALASDDSPVWTRLYGGPEVPAETCAILDRVLAGVGAKRLVVGHTVQKAGISSACKDKLFRIDVGLSDYYGDHPTQVLEITAGGTRVLTVGATDGAKKSPPRDSAVQSQP